MSLHYVSEQTGLDITVPCRFVGHGCSPDTTAVALRGQWSSGDYDVDPVWVPVCTWHDRDWDLDEDYPGGVLPEKYRLARFEIPQEEA